MAQDIEPQRQMTHNLQELQYTHTRKPQQVQDHFLTQPHEPQDMASFDSEFEPHQHNQHHPQMELTETQQQMHQRNLQLQMMEQMSDRVRLLERQVQQQNAQQEHQQGQQTVKGHGTSVDQLLEQPVQQDVTREQKQHQHPGIPM